MDLSIVSIVFGGIFLSAVVYKYLQKDPAKNPTVTCFLCLLGFALVASPAWTTISWKSNDSELTLLRESTRQMGDYVRILSSYDKIVGERREAGLPHQFALDFNALAKQLNAQKDHIERALVEDDITKAISETQLSSQLIENIANLLSSP